MIGATDDGVHDQLLEFVHAVSGAYFFAPSLRVLRRLGRDRHRMTTRRAGSSPRAASSRTTAASGGANASGATASNPIRA